MTIEGSTQALAGEVPANGISTRTVLLALGAAIYAISFALPAVSTSTGGHDGLAGWQCAVIALTSVGHPSGFMTLPLFASGLVNPLALAYLLFCASGKRSLASLTIAMVTLVFVAMSWLVIADGLAVEIGHVAWVAGLLLMMVPEIVGITRTQARA
jgi:hypothetical protein